MITALTPVGPITGTDHELATAAVWDAARAAHTDHYTQWAQNRSHGTRGHDFVTHYQDLADDWDNLRAALDQLLADHARGADLIRTLISIRWWLEWHRRSL